ncbi:MAG: undecaprenyldiphospho-muramoylpentapeptide beta-N-acetylglucosaminyltransferase [Rhodothermales bacterium]
MEQFPRILFAGGGTGGHVYPAIAIADAIRKLVPRASIEFAGTKERMEWQAVPKAGYTIHPITVSAFHRKNLLRNVGFPFKLLQGLWQSRSLSKQFDPHVVVGTGGFVSGPVLWTASMGGKPIVIQEQNAFAGVTNKLLGKRAKQIHIAFPEAEAYFPPGRCYLSGNPTRAILQDADRAEGRQFYAIPPDAELLFVFGGSLGSAALNAAMARHLDALLADDRRYIIWQTGRIYYDRYREQVPEHERLQLRQYIDRMDLAYAASDVTLCRAGAISCSELMVTQSPAILVPSPNVAEDHQTYNAKSLVDAGAAVLLREADLDAQLVDHVRDLMADDERRAAMRNALTTIARPDAADTIAREVLALAGWDLEKDAMANL